MAQALRPCTHLANQEERSFLAPGFRPAQLWPLWHLSIDPVNERLLCLPLCNSAIQTNRSLKDTCILGTSVWHTGYETTSDTCIPRQECLIQTPNHRLPVSAHPPRGRQQLQYLALCHPLRRPTLSSRHPFPSLAQSRLMGSDGCCGFVGATPNNPPPGLHQAPVFAHASHCCGLPAQPIPHGAHSSPNAQHAPSPGFLHLPGVIVIQPDMIRTQSWHLPAGAAA